MYNDHVILVENAINFEIALSIHGLVIMGIEILVEMTYGLPRKVTLNSLLCI